MKINGILSKIMDNYLCLRGVGSIKALAAMSEVNPDIQRDLLAEHSNEMKDFLEKGEYTFFPEVVLSMNISAEAGEFESLQELVDSTDKGFKKKVGNIKISFKPDSFKLIDERKQLKVAQFEFDETVIRLSRIDGNHRLSAAAYLTSDILIPFCVIVFPSDNDAQNNSRAIFHNINSKQIPLQLEQNIKIIIETAEVFPDKILEKSQPFGLPYKFTRELLCGDRKLDFDCFPQIKRLIFTQKFSFFVDLFKFLLKENLLNQDTAVTEMKGKLNGIENALKDAGNDRSAENSAIVGALAYYKLSNNIDKYNRFVKWITRNNLADAKTVNIADIISIFDKVYDSIPKKVFLARWYPAESDENYTSAKHRFDAIKEVANELNLELIDMGTKDGGTFDIRSVMYNEIKDSDIFVADLTGCRHNVMVEVGYALKTHEMERMLFYFAKTTEPKYDIPPFDVTHLRYEPISEAAEIKTKVKQKIQSIIEEME